MDIKDIKAKLSISNVLEHYNLQANKNGMLHCPFHDDKTPSLQVYPNTNTFCCFSSNCEAGTGDVIQFIQLKEECSKHEAILKAKTLLGEGKSNSTQLTRVALLTKVFQYFQKAVYNSAPAKTYLQKRALDIDFLQVGYHSGQFHHRQNSYLIESAVKYGLLKSNPSGGYFVFGKGAICFPLKNEHAQIVSLYFRSIRENGTAKHLYLANRQGLYPGFPPAETKRLILTESIIDAATLLQQKQLTQQFQVLALYGTNGFTPEHQTALKNLKHLEEIVCCFDNDEAGQKAVTHCANLLKQQFPNLIFSNVIPVNKDINETLVAHEPSIFSRLFQNRKSVLFSTEKQVVSKPVGSNSMEFLKSPHLLKKLNFLIGQAGIVGEENSRMLLFLIIISYVNKSPLHALVQGSSGSGKTHIINRIADMMPQEDVLRFTRITESSLYNWGEFDLFKKVIIIEDLDGLKEDALYALREFISNQVLRSSVTIKDKKGNNKSRHKIVKGQFSSLSATTKGETYEDNMSRSFLVAVDESNAQTKRIIQYQNKKNAGQVKPQEQQNAVNLVQNLVRNLKHLEVINPYAPQLNLPDKVHKIRRLNEMYQAVIKQVTFVNQHQRKRNEFNQLITEVEDIQLATEILFESIVLKVDELDGSLRQFFERLKKFMQHHDQEFLLREVRQQLNVSKTQTFRYMQSLTELEYVKQIGGYANKGIKYKIAYWDNYHKIREEIKQHLLKQIQNLKKEGT